MLTVYDYKLILSLPPHDSVWVKALAKSLISVKYNTAFYQNNSAPGREEALLGL